VGARDADPNAFPEPLRPSAHDVAHRLAAFALACQHVVRDVPQATRLTRAFDQDTGPDVLPTPEKPLLVMYEAASFVSSVYGMLLTLKSLLDVYAPFVTGALSPAERLRGFNKETFEGMPKVPGANLLKWLRNHANRGDDVGRCSGQLYAILKQEIEGWISPAVRWRDQAAHAGRLIEFVPMQARVIRSLKTISESDVVGPLMPDRTPVSAYAQKLLDNTVSLIGKTVRLLPHVETSLLSPAITLKGGQG
jgi:hypothetical protein